MTLPNHSWVHQHDQLEQFAKTFDRSVRLAIAPTWLGTMAKTLGCKVYIPADWTVRSVRRIIPHEVQGHVKQFRYCGFGIHPNLGFLGMILIYLWGVILPICLAWGRYRCELHAENASWRYHLENRIWSAADVQEAAVSFAADVSGKSYLYAWPPSWTLWGFKRRARKTIRQVLEVRE